MQTMQRYTILPILMLLLVIPARSQSPPPNYNYNQLPVTSFTCADKATGGYYADPEAGCQMFHVCLRVSEEEINDFKFLCPNNTVFDQQNFICTNWWEINCERSTRYYSKNDLFKVDTPTTIPPPEPESTDNPGYWEYVYEYIDPVDPSVPSNQSQLEPHRLQVNSKSDRKVLIDIPSHTSTTTSTTSSTTTPRTTTDPPITTFRNAQRSHSYSKIKLGKPAYETGTKSPINIAQNSTRRRSKSFPTTQTPKPNTEVTTRRISSSVTDDRKRWKHKRRQRPSRTQTRGPEEKHKEFSNFRFYKTAFGRSYSSDDYLLTTSTTTERSSTQRSRFFRPGRTRTRLGRTASRSTRYSKYAR